VCAHGRVCHEFGDTVQKCFETVHFRVRASVPAVSIQRRIEQHLHIRRVVYEPSQLFFGLVAEPAAGEGYVGYAVSYIDRDSAVAQAVLHALGTAVVDAQFAPFQAPDFGDLIKQEWYLNQDNDD
jgi:3'-phosphoadenosine 5'-phosphosulfate (PAPS) 3'-phosphatase